MTKNYFSWVITGSHIIYINSLNICTEAASTSRSRCFLWSIFEQRQHPVYSLLLFPTAVWPFYGSSSLFSVSSSCSVQVKSRRSPVGLLSCARFVFGRVPAWEVRWDSESPREVKMTTRWPDTLSACLAFFWLVFERVVARVRYMHVKLIPVCWKGEGIILPLTALCSACLCLSGLFICRVCLHRQVYVLMLLGGVCNLLKALV